MSSFRRFVRRHRFSTFVALTFALTWLPWLAVAAMLRTGRPPVVTTLVLVIGVVWAVWHVPLFLMPGSSQAGTPFWLYAPIVVGISVMATWLYNAAGGRVLVVVVFHTLSNAVSASTAGGIVGDGVGSLVAVLIVVWIVAGLLVRRYGAERLSDRSLPDGGLDFETEAATRAFETPTPEVV
jgi:hypothetical protein